MEIRVNATRMELLKLRRRSELARRGHKLLKDKLDGLVQDFIKTSKMLRKLYSELGEELILSFSKNMISKSEVDRDSYRAALLYPTAESKIKESLFNLMGVKVPKFEYQMLGDWKSFGEKFFTADFIKSMEEFKELLPKLVKMAEFFVSLQRIGREIVEIKRRVNALEYVLIPELEDKVRYIKMRLSEMERDTTVSLLKIKELVS